jgi:hypothetical protein
MLHAAEEVLDDRGLVSHRVLQVIFALDAALSRRVGPRERRHPLPSPGGSARAVHRAARYISAARPSSCAQIL